MIHTARHSRAEPSGDNAFTKLLDSEKLEKQKGEIRCRDLTTLLDATNTPKPCIDSFFDLMRNFECVSAFPTHDTHY